MAMTKREYFAEIRTILENAGTHDYDPYLEFIDHEVELLNKKNSAPRKPTAKQIANETYKARILAGMGDEPMTASAITKAVFADEPDVKVQKVSALLKQLVEDNALIKTVEKRVSYFSKVA